MQTIFDKPLDKQVADNTQAIANLGTLETIHANIANNNVSSGTIVVEQLNKLILITFKDVRSASTVSAGGNVVVGELESGYRPNSFIVALGEGASGGNAHLVRLGINASGQISMANYGSANTNFYANGILIYPLH